MPTGAEIARLNELISRWKSYRSGIAEANRYCALKQDLYQVRNAGWKGNPPLAVWPARLIDPDDAMMAAVEHYFLCRCWIGTAQYSALQLRAMNLIYNAGKAIGVTPRHNPTKPVTPPSYLQMAAQEAGIRDGENDLRSSGKEAPLLATPPKYY